MRSDNPGSVENLFDAVAQNYDPLNDVFSFGLHRVWKRQLLIWLQPVDGESWLDLCCGTGDLALALARCVRPNGSVLGIDSAEQPLSIAKKRALNASWLPISWQKGDALDTGLSSNQFDGAVMAYGLRNLADPSLGLKELRRLLKKSGRAGILDFNRTEEGSLSAQFQRLYLRRFVVPVAAQVGFREHYAYLEESLKRFPNGSVQESLALEAGFEAVSYRTLAGGQMGALLLQA